VIDEIAAPVQAFADELPTMFTPSVAPHDVLAWMYEALGVDAPQLLDDDQGHRLLPGLMRCYQRRGTRQGLEELLRLRYGVSVEVLDPGGTTWSVVPTTPKPLPSVTVTVVLDTDEPLTGLDEVVRNALPVTVEYRVARRIR
jgi:phage tail-like protein